MKSLPISNQTTAHLLMKLSWQTATTSHKDCVFVEKANFWRDILPSRLTNALMGKCEGDSIRERLCADEAFGPRNPALVHEIRPSQIDMARTGGPLVPGRHYPKGVIDGMAGIYPQNVTPFRCLFADSQKIVADFNHPLAGRDMDVEIRVEAVRQKEREGGGSCRNLEDCLGLGPGMQAPLEGAAPRSFGQGNFGREDEAADSLFYEKPRLVNHLDDTALKNVSEFYRAFLQPGMAVLDLMASWDSHIPKDIGLGSLQGLGMNRAELEQNPLLGGFEVADLNLKPALPYRDNTFDAVICTVSVEYLTRPLAVFEQVLRVLKPGGVFAVTFSNRWFPPKAINLWKHLHEFERLGLVTDYFAATPGFGNAATFSLQGLPRPKGDKYARQYAFSDPVFGVWAHKGEKGRLPDEDPLPLG